MARLARTTADYHQDHLRRLIDQRAARADLPGPSPQFADTPSVYSPSIAVFSPYSQAESSNSRYTSPNTMQSSVPTSSMLDLDDDIRNSTCSLTQESNETFQDPDYDDDEDEDDDFPNRMSLLGPKMRFHSRAPWETGEDSLTEEEEVPSPTYEGAFAVSDNTPSRMPNMGGIKKGFRFGAVKPSRGSDDSESSRSQGKYKQSFETTSSHSSHTSHSLNPSFAQSETPTSILPPSPHSIFRYKFSSNKNSNTPPLTPTVSSPSSDTAPSADHLRFCAESPVPWISAERRPSASTLPLPNTHEYKELVHPYANPDLVITSAEDLPSNLAEYVYSNGSRSEARITPIKTTGISPSRPTNTVVLTPTSSTSSFRDNNQERPLRSRTSNIQAKDISSPIPVQNSSVPDLRSRESKPTDTGVLPGWYNNASPAFNLISLEEARAKRSRSATANAAIHPSQVAESPIREAFGKDNTRPMALNPRTRSISAGIRPKLVGDGLTSSDPQQSSPIGNTGGAVKQTLKHKKSGFMRIFNSKERDKERPKTPPPAPIALDDHIANAQPRPSDFSKLSVRVPVPPISPQDNSPSADASFISNSSMHNDHLAPVASPQKSSPISRRIFSSTLSISTASSPSQGSRITSASSDKRFSSWVTTPPSSDVDMVPQSAPAHVTDFPALKLRPVSTMFSAHFRDHLIKTDVDSEEPYNEPQSPSSSGQPTRPVTPGSLSRSDFTGLGPAMVSSEDPASVIQALQNQIVSVRKAWQLEIWDLEGQVRDLKTQVEDMRISDKEYCETCGRGRRLTDPPPNQEGTKPHGVVNRPRARTGASRFANGG